MTLQAPSPPALGTEPAGDRLRRLDAPLPAGGRNPAPALRAGRLVRLLWLGFGWTCVLLGVIGAVLPLMPTTVFLLLAAWSFSRGSPRFHRWLIAHPRLGPPIRVWREHGAISRPAKLFAMISLVLSFGLAVALGAAPWALLLCALCLSAVAGFLLTRPAPPT